ANETDSGWQQANFSAPIAIRADTTYLVSYNAPVGAYSVDAGYFAKSGVDNGPLHALRDGEDGANSVFEYGQGIYPTKTWQSSNYWVDVVFSPQSTAPAPQPTLLSLVCTPASLTSGAVGTCTCSLDSAAPSGGAIVSISKNTTNLTVPASATVPAGSKSVSFAVTAGTITTNQSAVVTASYGGVTKTNSISLVGSTTPVVLSKLSCLSTSLRSGQSSTCTVDLTGMAPSGGVTVAISDTNVNLTVPASLVITSGASSATFSIVAGTISSDQSAVVTASVNGSSQAIAIALLSTPSTTSIWSASTVPSVVSTSDSASVELGLKFQSSIAGYVTGVRFYKGSGNTGTHIGHLWSKTGSLLATSTFTGESSSGWQETLFPTPIAIKANTTYVVSYLAPRGRYAINTNYFAAAGTTNGALTALRSGADGGNGVFVYGSGGFPNSTWQTSNYWVDVVFTPQAVSLQSDASSRPQPELSQLAAENSVSLAEPTPRSAMLSCSPRAVRAGDSFRCVVRKDVSAGDLSGISIAANSTDVRLPDRLVVRGGLQEATFHGSVDLAARNLLVTISVGEGGAVAEDQIEILPSGAPVLSIPQVLYVRTGEPAGFVVAVADGEDLPVSVRAGRIPAGAVFDTSENSFLWTPDASQQGEYTVRFEAKNAAGASSIAETRIVVSSGRPAVSGQRSLECAPGSAAALLGRWLVSNEDVPASSILRIDGEPAPLISADSTRITFACPETTGSSARTLTLETADGAADPVAVTTVEAIPFLQTISEAGTEGLIRSTATGWLATVRDVRQLGEPAGTGSLISLRATGLGRWTGDVNALTIRIGGVEAQIESATADPRDPGVVEIHAWVSEATPGGDAIPVTMDYRSGGKAWSSNTVTMAIERGVK
ncbi:MAG TPA: DUF4082 domain-containing protein, partial [Bryobacteraceae bacterium]|nr:DUF4082 domain-containing protein [Bryobacteraceae bacterium]